MAGERVVTAASQIEFRPYRIAVVDIENSPDIGAMWERYDARALWIEQPWHMLSFAVRWYGEKKTTVRSLPDYPEFETDIHDDSALARDLHQVFDSADLIVGHNVVQFDIAKANWRFIKAGLPVPSPYKTFDTLLAMRKIAKSNDNTLNWLAQELLGQRKLAHEGIDLWKKCYHGDSRAYGRMARYNKHDVDLTVKLYEIVRPWAPSHPNINLTSDNTEGKCPRCGSLDLECRGHKEVLAMRYRQYRCRSCGAWPRGRTGERIPGVVYK